MNARLLKIVQLPLLVGIVALSGGCKKKDAYAPPPSKGGSGGAIVSAEKNSFDQVTSRLDKGGSLYMYISTEQALAGLSKTIGAISNALSSSPAVPADAKDKIGRVFEVVGDLIKDSGVEHISGIGASSIAREPGFYYNKFIVHHYEGEGDGLMWTMFGKEPHPLKELDLLPEDTAFAAYGDMDVPLVWKAVVGELKRLHLPEVDKGLADLPEKFKAVAGISLDDVLGSLGGGYGVIFTLDEGTQVSLPIPGAPMQIPEPGLALYAKVKNDAIYNRIDQLTIGNPLVAKSDEAGLKTISVAIPIPLPIRLRPTIARSKDGDYLFLTSSDKLLHDILDVQAGKKKGYKTTDEFKKLSQGIPTEGNNYTLISEKFGKIVQQAVQGAVSARPEMGGQTKTLQDMMAANPAAFTYSVGVNGPEGWEAFANGNKSMGTAVMVLPAVAAGGLLAAIAIPNFVRARATSQENACINNLRLIDASKQQWALERHKQNTDTPTMADLTPYLGRGTAGEFPNCPQGGTYIIGSVGEKPRCTIPGHVLP